MCNCRQIRGKIEKTVMAKLEWIIEKTQVTKVLIKVSKIMSGIALDIEPSMFPKSKFCPITLIEISYFLHRESRTPCLMETIFIL